MLIFTICIRLLILTHINRQNKKRLKKTMMIKNRLLYTIYFVLSLGAFTSCTLNQMTQLAGEQELEIVPSPLELHGDSVRFTMSAKLPNNMLKPGALYEVEVTYKPETGEELFLGAVTFNQADYAGSTDQPSISQRFSFLYNDNLEKGQVYVKGTIRKDDKFKETPKIPVPNGGMGVITTSRLSLATYYVSYVDHGYDAREEYESKTVDFYFVKGSSNLRASEKRSEQGKQLENYIAAKNPTRNVNITGMHSPEGSTSINNQLANDRPKVVEGYYKELLEKFDYTDGKEGLSFVSKPVVENWNKFKDLVKENGSLSDAQKDEILSIVNGPGNFVSKELKLQSLPSYRTLVREVYPPLRNAQAEMLRILDKLSEAEIIVLAQKISKGEEDANKLSDAQLAFAAYKTPDLKERERMYKAAIKKNDGFAAYNNLGAVYLEMAQQEADKGKMMAMIDKAIPHLEKSLEKLETPEALANMAGVKLMKGEQEEAYKILAKVAASSSSAVGMSTNALKGIAAIRRGNYQEATQFLSSAGNNATIMYNKALAFLLKASVEASEDGYRRAATMFEEAISTNDQNAYAHYGLAIASARAKDETKMGEALTKAVGMSSMFKTRAVSDLEFLDYRASTIFKGALK